MASFKLSGLGAVTSTANDSLLYVADTSDSGSTYTSKRITVSNFLNGYATQSYVTQQINNLVDGAPTALDTLNELAAAINDDASIASSLTSLINANETHIDNAATLTGVAKDSTALGTFTGSTIADGVTIKAALQALETAVESNTLPGLTASVAELNILDGVTASTNEINLLDGVTATTAELNYVDGVTSNIQTQLDAKATTTALNSHITTATAKHTDIDDVITLTGIAENTTNLGTFTGGVIADNTTIKTALQSLETAVELRATSATVTEIDGNADDLISLTGVAENSTNLGSFTGSTIANDLTIKAALQSLETAVEANALTGLTSTVTELNVLDGITSSTAELNILTGVTSTAAELNILDGVTATAAELNILDGVTSSTAELNLLDGVTATTAEINYLDGVTSAIQTQLNSKQATLTGLTSTVAELNILDGVTATAAELNILDGVTATATELNYVDGVTSAIQTQINGKVATGANVNTLVGNTTAQTVPVDGSGDDNYLFLVVDKSDGSLKAITKTFLEIEG